MALPIFGRLSFADWQRIAFTFLILALEQVLRVVVFVIPVSVIDWTRYHLVTYTHKTSAPLLIFRNVYPRIFRGYGDEDIRDDRNKFIGAKNTVELIQAQYRHRMTTR